MKRRQLLHAVSFAATVSALGVAAPAFAQDTITVGILRSLSGTMAIS